MARNSRNDQAGVDLPKAPINRESMREVLALLRYLRPYRVRFVLALLALFGSNLLGLAFPFLAGKLIDAATTPGPGIHRIALALIAVLAAQSSLSFFHALSFASVGQRGLVDLRRDTYSRLLSLPMSFFARRRVGELTSRLSADLIQIEDTLIALLPQFLRQMTLLAGGAVLIALTSLKLSAHPCWVQYRRHSRISFPSALW